MMKQAWILDALASAEAVASQSPATAHPDINGLVKQVVNETCHVTAESPGCPDEESALRRLIVSKILQNNPAGVGTGDSIYLQSVGFRPPGSVTDAERSQVTYVGFLSKTITVADLLKAIRSAHAYVKEQLAGEE